MDPASPARPDVSASTAALPPSIGRSWGGGLWSDWGGVNVEAELTEQLASAEQLLFLRAISGNDG